VTPAQARAEIAAHADLRAFISVSDTDEIGDIVAIKDLVDVRGMVTTGGGTLLEAVPAVADAPVVERIRKAGGVIIGKTNLHEWALGLTSENPHYGAVRNPSDPERVAGGSSGGSAVAVATGMCDWALGTDTGGSIRVPAAYCGVVGFKPTVGSVETEGVFPLSRTLDTVGPLAGDVTTAARALQAMSGLGDLIPDRPRSLAQLRLATARDWALTIEPDLLRVWEMVTVGLPQIDFSDPDIFAAPGSTILLAEAFAVHRHWIETRPEQYGHDVLALLKSGAAISRAEYSRALFEQSRLRCEAENRLEEWDALLVPATRVRPPRVGADYRRSDLSGLTRPFNLTGHPVIAMPVPVPGLPVGIQVVGHFGRDAELVEVALALESAWKSRAAQGWR